MRRVLNRAQKTIFTPQSLLKTPWMPVFLSRQPLEHLLLLPFLRMLLSLFSALLWAPRPAPLPPALQRSQVGCCLVRSQAQGFSSSHKCGNHEMCSLKLCSIVRKWAACLLHCHGSGNSAELGLTPEEKFKSVQGREELEQAISWRHQRSCWACVLAGSSAGSRARAAVVCCGSKVCFSEDGALQKWSFPYVKYHRNLHDTLGEVLIVFGWKEAQRSRLRTPWGWWLYLNHLSTHLAEALNDICVE